MSLSFLQAVLFTVTHAALMLSIAPLIVGMIRKVKARFQCRRGASIFQPYADLTKLFRKQPVVSSTTSWIFTATPYIFFATTLTAGLLVPVFFSQMPLNFAGNIIALVYLLSFVLGFFGVSVPLIHSSGTFGILFSLFVVVVAALNLVLDFDFIEQGVNVGAPKHMEWYGAFGLLVTLVWLYLEILRLLSKLQSRR